MIWLKFVTGKHFCELGQSKNWPEIDVFYWYSFMCLNHFFADDLNVSNRFSFELQVVENIGASYLVIVSAFLIDFAQIHHFTMIIYWWKAHHQKKNFTQNLGVLMSSGLSRRLHISYIIDKSNQPLGFLWQTFHDGNMVSAKKQLYLTPVKPQLTYSSPIWHSHI